jgi:hypothetical protein
LASERDRVVPHPALTLLFERRFTSEVEGQPRTIAFYTNPG